MSCLKNLFGNRVKRIEKELDKLIFDALLVRLYVEKISLLQADPEKIIEMLEDIKLRREKEAVVINEFRETLKQIKDKSKLK